MFRINKLNVVAILLCFVFSSCGTLGIANNLLAGKESRGEMLAEKLKRFHRELYWGGVDQAANFLKPEDRDAFIKTVSNTRKTEKLVDLEIGKIDYSEARDKASVNVLVRYFRIPSYTVEARTQTEQWEFDSFAGGWWCKGINLRSSDPNEATSPYFRGTS